MDKPDCYQCQFRRSIPGDAHSNCTQWGAKVTGNPHGIKRGWFLWPFNFDPTWLELCDSFQSKDAL